ncbi:MAG: EamA family transporter [Candidatus Nanohalobium sp.]
MELGILLATMVALIKGYQSIYQRRNALGTDEFVTAWSSRAFGLPILLIALLYQGIPELGLNFFLLAIPQSAVIALTSVLIAKAYKESDASIVTPMFAISPLLVLITSFLILGEVPSIYGGLGVILIALGAYALKLERSQELLDPLKKLWEERGVQIILVVILIYSVTANIDKIGVNMSSPVMWPLTIYTMSSIIMLPIMMGKSQKWKLKLKREWKPLSLLGGLGAVGIIFQMMAIKLTLVSYVISIKRLSIPITVIFSYFMLDEKSSFKQRIAGATLMAFGALLIYI